MFGASFYVGQGLYIINLKKKNQGGTFEGSDILFVCCQMLYLYRMNIFFVFFLIQTY